MTEPMHQIERHLARLVRDSNRVATPHRVSVAAVSAAGTPAPNAASGDRTSKPGASGGNNGQQLVFNRGEIAGLSLLEATGTTSALIRLYDGLEAADEQLIMPISLAPGESARDWFLPSGPGYQFGLYLEIVSGIVDGTIFTIAHGHD